MNIAILDDSKEDLQQIRNVVSSYYESRNTQANIRLFSSAESFFKKYSPGVYDLVIMDIYMDTMTGMDAARKLREADDPAALIFITSSDSYAVESYDVRASYYLLKPFDPEKLQKILSSLQIRQSQNSRYIELVSDRTPVRVPIRSILYVDTYRNAIQVHTDAGIIRSYITFQKFEELLGRNEMLSLLLQRMHCKYGSHCRIHRRRISHGQPGTCDHPQAWLQCHQKSISGISVFFGFRIIFSDSR